MYTIAAHTSLVSSCSYERECGGVYLVTGGYDSVVKVWDLNMRLAGCNLSYAPLCSAVACTRCTSTQRICGTERCAPASMRPVVGMDTLCWTAQSINDCSRVLTTLYARVLQPWP